ncbi:hypothetical protein CHARACLAT_029651 [Characodon lateralis]|uniref:Uncharacterized protein n=1 Tax=Characodon lateralis TaxID=208331 RepID=A0ABU7EE68_9TELE|nr:hypothetical protein [Characodon lateralis]
MCSLKADFPLHLERRSACRVQEDVQKQPQQERPFSFIKDLTFLLLLDWKVKRTDSSLLRRKANMLLQLGHQTEVANFCRGPVHLKQLCFRRETNRTGIAPSLFDLEERNPNII